VDRGLYHVCFRLVDSLPVNKVGHLLDERSFLLANPTKTEKDRFRLIQISRTLDRYLDIGWGECHMRDNRIANIVCSSIRFFDTERYDLFAWCIMPNHVHLILQPKASFTLEGVMHSIKSFTANEINRVLDQSGPVWMKESFDHLIRSEGSFYRHLAYLRRNPIKAGLIDWPWVG
jgi:REP element-mobilizing transposase RayT